MDVLLGAGSHPDPVWVHREARKVVPDITLATVQRTLSLLREAGLVGATLDKALDGGDAKPRLGANGVDGPVSCYAHCARCHRDVDIGSDACRSLLQGVASATGFVITGPHLHLYGLCPDCAQACERD